MRTVKAIIVFLAVFAVISCAKLDVVGKKSIESFGAVLEKLPQKPAADDLNTGWKLSAPDNSAQFFWSGSYSESNLYDVMLVFSAQPFIEAGLDVEKLSQVLRVFENTIIVGTKLEQGNNKLQGDLGPIASYEQIVKVNRDRINYHGALDHYGIVLDGGNMFEWARDMGTNDKDIVFVLNPEPFIAAGVDPNKIEGWVFAKVPVDDENGKPIQVDKLLKPFNLY
jgi:hypothetical protein